METLNDLINQFWNWAEIPDYLRDRDITALTIEPLYFPEFDRMRKICISLVNTELEESDINSFLFCMSLDTEEEFILDYCKKNATEDFLCAIIPYGIIYSQTDTRWQIAELLRRPLPNRDVYLLRLLCDENAYVRKRAINVQRDINDLSSGQ